MIRPIVFFVLELALDYYQWNHNDALSSSQVPGCSGGCTWHVEGVRAVSAASRARGAATGALAALAASAAALPVHATRVNIATLIRKLLKVGKAKVRVLPAGDGDEDAAPGAARAVPSSAVVDGTAAEAYDAALPANNTLFVCRFYNHVLES